MQYQYVNEHNTIWLENTCYVCLKISHFRSPESTSRLEGGEARGKCPIREAGGPRRNAPRRPLVGREAPVSSSGAYLSSFCFICWVIPKMGAFMKLKFKSWVLLGGILGLKNKFKTRSVYHQSNFLLEIRHWGFELDSYIND